MNNLPIPNNEAQRLAALNDYHLLDSANEIEFDRLTELASIICDVPIALVSLIDKDRQWFKSRVGLGATETPRDISFCQYAIMHNETFEITDANQDERFKNNPLVTGDPNIRFYAGHPLMDPSGLNLGTLCVIDRVPRKLTSNQTKALELLAQDVVTQIVSRKRNKEREKLEKLFENSIDFICIAGTDGFLKKVNPYFGNHLGYSETELLSNPFTYFIHPEDITCTMSEVSKLAVGEKTINFKNRYRKKNGDYISINWVANPDPKTGELFAIGRDISEQLETLQQLKNAKIAAEKSNQIKEEFLSNMSHEIRTPLNAMLGFNDLMYKTNLDEIQKKYTDIIKNSSKELLTIVNDILDTSKLESGKVALESKVIQLKEIAQKTINLKLPQANEKGLKILLNTDSSIPENLLGDSTRISQILNNLIGNAIKFTHSGSIELKLIQLSKNNTSCTLRIIVSDTGIGIPSDKLKAIFERFSQAETSTTREYGGTGLGLNIVRMLVNLHHGKITVKSELGKGTEFIVDLPFDLSMDLSSSDSIDKNNHKIETTQKLSGIKVLLVEDNIINVLLAKTHLEDNGAFVKVSENGQECIDELKQQHFDVVLMDLQMPVMDGYTAAKFIRNDMKSNIPIIACSAHTLVSEQETCLNHGMNSCISKPFSEDELVTAILECTNHASVN